MSDRQYERPFREAKEASQGRADLDSDTASPRDGGASSQLRDALRRGPDDETKESIARATAVVGEDEGGGS